MVTGEGAELIVLAIDAETLAVERVSRTYERIADRRWRVRDRETTTEFDVDEYGVPTDVGHHLKRVT